MKLGLSIIIVYLLFLGRTFAHAEDSNASFDPETELEMMDKRIPVPLVPHMALHQKQNMREHLEAIQSIVVGISMNDFKMIETAAAKMGYTKKMEQMCQMMGAGAEGFAERAISFHKTAEQVVLAAKSRDKKKVLSSLADTLAQCTSCHGSYRQQVVDDATLQQILSAKSQKIRD
jgi:hypothetical protein